MKTASPLLLHLRLPRVSGLLLAFALALATAFTAGCGRSNFSAFTSPGSTSVTLLLSSTVNDQLSKVVIALNSITLTSQSGKTVDLFTQSVNNDLAYRYLAEPEFIHLNGIAEPLVTVSVPQDVYTSATVTIASFPSSYISCVAATPSSPAGTLTIYSSEPLSQAPITVNVPAPITIRDNAMGLSLDMLLLQNALAACTGNGSVLLTPTFNLTPVALSPQPTNSENGKETNLDGQVSSVNAAGNSFTLVLMDGQILSVNSNGSTVYQGVNGFSALTAGTFVDMDAAIQSDGSLLATRIAVEDTDTTNLSAWIGPVLQTNDINSIETGFVRQQQGYLSTSGQIGVFMGYDSSDAVFQISGQFTNLQDLPFPARFDAANIFGGQNVYITTHAVDVYSYPPATTITLMPQTINGTVVGMSSSGSFQIYSVSLASYDLPPILATQPGLSYTLNNPSVVGAYVDSSTQLLNKQQPLALGGVLRFNGLLFNDDGTMRMDCGQVNDGVAE